ncbi:MAG: hypothetical protein Q9182_007351 [Xanthomendoza sp. 2 TL-2023]
MVNTRAQKPPAAGDENTTTENNPPSVPVDISLEDDRDATGSRLRKRRRSASPSLDDSAHTVKRRNARIAPSTTNSTPTTIRNAEIFHQEAAPPHAAPPEQQAASSTALSDGGNGNQDGYGQTFQQSLEARQHTPAPNDIVVAQPTPDMHAVMSRILDHGEHVDSQFAAHGENVTGPDHGHRIVTQGASLQLKVQSLPILDNLAIQVLTTFAKTPYPEILNVTSDTESEPGAAYSTLKSLFDHTKKVYSIGDPFLSPRELGFVEREQTETIRKANLATFVSSVFGSQDVGFYHLDEFFLDTFLADGGRLLKNHASLFLDLKTQAYISAITQGERSREDILQDLFPEDTEQRLLDRRSGSRQPAPGETYFIQRATNRKMALLEEPMTADSISKLPDKYAWVDFLKDISAYVSKNFASIVGSSGRKKPNQSRSTNYFETEPSQPPKRQGARKQSHGQLPREGQLPPAAATTNTFARVAQMVPPATDDIAEKAARAAQFAMQDFGVNHESEGPSQNDGLDQQPQPPQYPFQFEQQPAPYYTQTHTQTNNSQQQQQPQHFQPGQQQPVDAGQPQNVYIHPTVPFPSQTAPTSVLYERARLAATAKASPSNRRAGHPSQRRPWAPEEENALMHGLDQVKGPHWSQILALYGPGGTIDETLKDRNQVQLKDKARNLKLFFLKSGIEVPYYLQFVTGELKTRAPQAVKLEMQRGERGEGQEEEEVGVTPLDGGGQGVEGTPDPNMEDGEGEVIDPAEYAAVHGAAVQADGDGLG